MAKGARFNVAKFQSCPILSHLLPLQTAPVLVVVVEPGLPPFPAQVSPHLGSQNHSQIMESNAGLKVRETQRLPNKIH